MSKALQSIQAEYNEQSKNHLIRVGLAGNAAGLGDAKAEQAFRVK